MLQSIHDNAKGWIAYLIVGLISIPFALFGINEYFSGGGNGAIAIIDGEEVTKREVQQEVSSQRQRMAAMFGGKLPQGLDAGLRQSALESLINRKVAAQHASHHGYRASNAEVLGIIHGVPQFQRDGQFSPEQYNLVMQSAGRTRKSYEEGLRNSVTENQFLDAVSDTALVSSLEASQLHQLDSQKRDIEVFEIKVADILKDIVITDEAIATYYKENPKRFQTEEQVSLAYVELSKDSLAKTLEASNDDLLGYYQDDTERFITKGKFKASHIRVSITETQDKAQAMAKAEAIYQSIQSGKKTFEQAMEAGEDDTVFAESGEVIGFIKQGVIAADFEKAVFAGKAGEVSAPVETTNGIEIIKVLALVAEKTQSFEDAKEEIRKSYLAEEADKQFDGMYDKLKNASFENDGSLDPAAKATGVAIQTSALFSRTTATGIFKNRELIEAAFSNKVLNAGINSALIELTPDHIIVVRLAEHKTPKPRSLDDVKDKVTELVKNKQAREQLKTKIDGLYKTVSEAGDFATLGDDASKVVKHDGLERSNNELSRQLVTAAFKLSAPEEGKKVFTQLTNANGDASIIALTAVKDNAEEPSEEAQNQWANYTGNRERVATMQALRENADVEIFIDRLSTEQ
ncbi:MAG: SurA N-terminal domain-containing protein [Thiotrichaceae bacterium]|nr:SurA N-terminal domain-containing protein [Thiotrichaceae bacterium]